MTTRLENIHIHPNTYNTKEELYLVCVEGKGKEIPHVKLATFYSFHNAFGFMERKQDAHPFEKYFILAAKLTVNRLKDI